MMGDQDTNNNFVQLTLRENLVKTAVQFLQNPKVSVSPLQQRREFLKRKGLTDEEIEEACKLAHVDINVGNKNVFRKDNEVIPIPYSQSQYHPYLQMNPYQPTLLQRVKEFFNTTALVGATLYSLYWFYKKFIKPFLFGRKKKDTVQDSISELSTTVQTFIKETKDSISKVETDVQKLAQVQTPDSTIPLLVQELKQDLCSLKALLLSRKQFPRAPASIPSWQLDIDAAKQTQEKPPEREDDAGSGSSTNNSDSSLEMIREDHSKE